MSCDTSTPAAATSRGISPGGPISVTRMPQRANAIMFERATRECMTSPTIATCRPSRWPTALRIVYRSSSAWVGCWCLPSPALITAARV